MTSPGNLVRAGGWSRNAVKAGDDVTVEFSPLRDATLRGGWPYTTCRLRAR